MPKLKQAPPMIDHTKPTISVWRNGAGADVTDHAALIEIDFYTNFATYCEPAGTLCGWRSVAWIELAQSAEEDLRAAADEAWGKLRDHPELWTEV